MGYATFCKLAGVDPKDEKAEKANLPPIDSIDQSDFIFGNTETSPREEIILGDFIPEECNPMVGPTYVQGLINNKGYKLLIGNVQQNIWQGPLYPNATTHWKDDPLDCKSEGPCLFNIFFDPTEHKNIAAGNPELVQNMLSRVKYLTSNSFLPSAVNRNQFHAQLVQIFGKALLDHFLNNAKEFYSLRNYETYIYMEE